MRTDDCLPAAWRRAALPRWTAIAALVVLSGCSKGATGKFIWMDELPASEIGSRQDSYETGPGDIVSVSVFGHPELSGRLKVRLDGFVTLPLVGDVPAAGKTLPTLSREVTKLLEDQKIVVGPRVSIVLDEVAPIKLSILGEVKNPGLYTLESGAGLAEALATSGGFTEFAHRDRLFIIRRVPELVRIRFRYNDLTAANGAAIKFRLKAGDTMLVQ
jgi:polysaccharide biosynthesis/export protein